MICSSCGEYSPKSYGGLCQRCYLYFRDGGEINPIPNPGEITYDRRGYVICHICGRAYVRVGSHVKETHHMTIKEYKEKFGLCANARTTEINYSKKMRDLAYENHMPEQLMKTGCTTRIQKGQGDKRLGKEIRLQERFNKKARRKASNPSEGGNKNNE